MQSDPHNYISIVSKTKRASSTLHAKRPHPLWAEFQAGRQPPFFALFQTKKNRSFENRETHTNTGAKMAHFQKKSKKVFAIDWHPQSMPRVLPDAPSNGDHESGLRMDPGGRVRKSRSFYGFCSRCLASIFTILLPTGLKMGGVECRVGTVESVGFLNATTSVHAETIFVITVQRRNWQYPWHRLRVPIDSKHLF